MRLSLSRTLRNPRAVPHWIEVQFKRLAEIPHLLPLEEVAEMAQPVWQLPRGLRGTVVLLSLAGLVLGVRVLDARIADSTPPATFGPVTSTLPSPAVEESALPRPGLEPAARTPRQSSDRPATAVFVDHAPQGTSHHFDMVEVTGYTSSASQTDSSPHLTASSKPPRPGTIALSRDLLRRFTPGAPFDFGDRVLVPGMGIYVVEDTMHPRWNLKADIWFETTAEARRWGVRTIYMTRIEAGEPILVPEGF